MRTRSMLLTVLVCAVVAPPAGADEAALLEEARQVAAAMPPKLLSVLQEEINRGGPEEAIAVCKEKAPAMARAASEETGWAIRRVSLKNRNPNAVPDDFERAVLEEFDRLAAAGADPKTLEKAQTVVVDGVPTYRYMKALPTQELCLNCHGKPEEMSDAVVARLEELYPDDRGTGYEVGQIRGAITIKKPL